MNKEKVLLENLIASKKNIKRKIMELKRKDIDSDKYFRKAFKPLIDPLRTRAEKNTSHSTELKNTETLCTSDEDVDDELNSSFENFFNDDYIPKRYDKSYGMHYDKSSDSYKIGKPTVIFNHGNLQFLNSYYKWTEGLWSSFERIWKPKTSKFHKWSTVVKPLYDRMKYEERQFNEEIAKINNSKTRINLLPLMNHLSKPNPKRSNIHDNTTVTNESLDFHPSASSSMSTDPAVENMISFSSPETQEGSGLYKDVLPQTQLVYYDDPNELVTRLNLLTSSQSVGNTGVNNEIISILEELRERNIIV
ncbi:uncharacterized protein LOC111027012 [Myzus persicae]|uniref:uncharacterized protein LOC111027012 n=1 Tax=Myzus persicae TaxID=13164 RepID=UPI000B9396CD|nr:uncharacterized protein LOC111027012 [Myzus persicae]